MRDTESMTAAADRSGGCLCGAVRYRIQGEVRDVVVCHCGRCRRVHGHVGAYTEARSQDLSLVADSSLRWYLADGRERGFCQGCGATLFWRRVGADRTSITAGTLDQPTGLRTAAHIFVASKGDYYEIADDLPSFAAGLDTA
jgi:hypothetical protein